MSDINECILYIKAYYSVLKIITGNIKRPVKHGILCKRSYKFLFHGLLIICKTKWYILNYDLTSYIHKIQCLSEMLYPIPLITYKSSNVFTLHRSAASPITFRYKHQIYHYYGSIENPMNSSEPFDIFFEKQT